MVARCYNGCWDTETQARFDLEDKRLASLRTVEPEAHCTYFPADELHHVHAWGRPLSGYHSTRMGALEDALGKALQ